MAEKKASIIVLTYNSDRDIDESLSSLRNQTYSNLEIIVVDNASCDNTVDIVKDRYPGVKIVRAPSNLGYAAGNNLGIAHADGDFIVIINPDTIADPDWLQELLKPFDQCRDVSITTSKILLFNNKKAINTCGNHTHFTGLSFCRGLNAPSSAFLSQEYLGSFSGCSFAIRREAVEALAGFDPNFFLYMEDVDLSWRARIAGYNILYVPDSVIYHKFEFTMAPWKEYYLERNRYIMLLKNYRMATLILMAPALAMVEAITLGFAVKNGPAYLLKKFQAHLWVLANSRKVWKMRRAVQQSRKISDREMIDKLEYNILPEPLIKDNIIYNKGTLFINYLFKMYYQFLIRVI